MTEEKKEPDSIIGTRVTRRKFLGTAAGGAAALAAVAAGGKLLPSAFAQAGASSTPIAFQPSAQTSTPPSTWDMTVDVLVVGAAGAGMSAAIAAATAGANTLIIEKMDHYGGLYLGAGGEGDIGGNNHIQQRDGITGDSIEKWFLDVWRQGDYRGNPEILNALVQNGDAWLYWMESLGAVWAPTGTGDNPPTYNPTTHQYGNLIPRTMQLAASSNYPTTNGFSWIFLFNKKLTSLGVPILLNHPMTSLYRQPNGPVVGVAVNSPTGPLTIQANRAVVLATGGTSDNVQLCHAYDPRYDNDMYHDGMGPPGTPDMTQNTGDGHLAAMAIGGGVTDMSYVDYLPIKWGSHLYWIWPTQNPRNYSDATGYVASSAGLTISNYQYVICVKGDGTRFVNESAAEDVIPTTVGYDPSEPWPLGYGNSGADFSEFPEHQFIRAWLNLPDRPRNCWAVADSVGAKALLWNTGLIANPNPMVSPALYPDSVATANDLQTLASLMGVDPTGLETTVTKYNGYVTAGADPDFGKVPQYPIATPPYYALKWTVVRHTQRNGIRVNSKLQVIDQMASLWQQDQELDSQPISIDMEPVIPHLYAAGECAAVFGWRRLHGSLPGYSLFGWLAGQHAAAETPLSEL